MENKKTSNSGTIYMRGRIYILSISYSGMYVDKYQYAPTKVYEDNQGTIALAKNPVNRQRCKHIDIKYHFIRETVSSKRVILEYCPTEQMIADVMTKPATKVKLRRFAPDLFST